MNNEWGFGIKRQFDGQPDRLWPVRLPIRLPAPTAEGSHEAEGVGNTEADDSIVETEGLIYLKT